MRPNLDALVLQVNNHSMKTEQNGYTWKNMYSWIFSKPPTIHIETIDYDV